MKLSRKRFEQAVLGATKPGLVEFWAGWPAPCRVMTQVVESVIEDPSAPVKALRVNVEENEALTGERGVRAVPTVLIFNQGSLREQIVGRATELEVREMLWSASHEKARSQTAVKTLRQK